MARDLARRKATNREAQRRRRERLTSATSARQLAEVDLDLVEKLASEGFPLRSIARRCGCAYSTFERWSRSNPRLEEALAQGRATLQQRLVNSLYLRAIDTKNPSGLVAGIFLLKAMCGFRDSGDGPDVKVGVQVVIPQALGPADPGTASGGGEHRCRVTFKLLSWRPGKRERSRFRPVTTWF